MERSECAGLKIEAWSLGRAIKVIAIFYFCSTAFNFSRAPSVRIDNLVVPTLQAGSCLITTYPRRSEELSLQCRHGRAHECVKTLLDNAARSCACSRHCIATGRLATTLRALRSTFSGLDISIQKAGIAILGAHVGIVARKRCADACSWPELTVASACLLVAESRERSRS